MIPTSNVTPPFDITRASHAAVTVGDLDRSVRFYTEVIGLVLTTEQDGVAYLRGIEESCHHSLILRASQDAPVCERLGMRVRRDEDLDAAKLHFDRIGVAAAFVDAPFQGRTLRLSDGVGIPIEFCAYMPPQPRLHDQFQLHKGAAALRYDHVQILAPDVVAASRFYTDLGFRIADYFVDRAEDQQPLGIFMHRKSNPHDVVFLTRPGPALHHFGYIVVDSASLFRALDVSINVGFGKTLERGPGRHGEGHALYVYFRDPDGHRVEILPPPIQMGDLEDEPARWHSGNRHSWDLPAPRSWLYETTPFRDVPIVKGDIHHALLSLEEYLARKTIAS